MLIPADKLPNSVAAIYPDGVDPHHKWEVGSDGIVLKAFEDKIITMDKLLDNIDLKLKWYIPSDHAIEFMAFIRMALGREPENSNSLPHYFFVDCIFRQPNVQPFFMVRNIDYFGMNDRIAILSCREFSKSSIVTYLFMFAAIKGKLPGFGKINYMLYVGDTMENNVKTTMGMIKQVFLESPYMQQFFESWKLNVNEVLFVRKPITKSELRAYEDHVIKQGKSEDTVPGRMLRTFTLGGVGAEAGVRGTRSGLARPDASIFDDLIKGEKAAASKSIMTSIESTIEADVLPGLNNNKNFAVIIGTPYGKNDSVTRRIEEGTWLPVVFPRGESIREDMVEDEFVSVWPDRHSFSNCMRDYRRAQRAKDAGNPEPMKKLMQEHYLRTSTSEDKMLQQNYIQWFNRVDIQKRMSDYNIYITTDFTSSNDLNGDYSGIAVWAVNSNMDHFMLDLSLRKCTIEDQYDELFRFAQLYTSLGARYIEVGIELDGNQRAHLEAVRERMPRKGIFFTFARAKGSKAGSEGITSRLEGGNKHWRFRMTLPLFQNRKIWFPRELQDIPDMKVLMEQLMMIKHDSFGCFSADTLVKCIDGEKYITDITNEDMVLATNGSYSAYVKPKNAIFTGNKEIYELVTADGLIMRLTGCHRVMTARGYVRVDDLRHWDVLIRNSICKMKDMDSSGEKNQTDTINPQEILTEKENGYTEKCLKEKLAHQSREGLMCIMLTKIKTTMKHVISSFLPDKSIKKYTKDQMIISMPETNHTEKKHLQENNRIERSTEYVNGAEQSLLCTKTQETMQNIAENRVEVKQRNLDSISIINRFKLSSVVSVQMRLCNKAITKFYATIQNVQKYIMRKKDYLGQKKESARIAERNLSHQFQTKLNIAEKYVLTKLEKQLNSNANVENVEKNLWDILFDKNIALSNADLVSIEEIKNTGKNEPVYDIEVPGYSNFVVNGCIVHNSRHDDGPDLISQIAMMQINYPMSGMTGQEMSKNAGHNVGTQASGGMRLFANRRKSIGNRTNAFSSYV
jgi:hypothetical protein